MKVFATREELETYIQTHFPAPKKIGFVPTMGALHRGHLSLIEESKKQNDCTVASIFVNPTQFDNSEDLDKYPRTLESDLRLLEAQGCDVVFTPSVEEIYANNVSSQNFDFDGLENEMEGQFRTGHFDGVGTIVKTLFDIINPTHAYFGEKDFQQLQIIKKMVEKHDLPVLVVGCPIYRESNGLAMSSRNERLSSEQRLEASIIFEILQKVREMIASENLEDIQNWVQNQFENHPLFTLEYFSIAEENTLQTATEIDPKKSYRAFIAVYADSVRLIDNLSLSN
jgi:pantoate--beta-alanine ligase